MACRTGIGHSQSTLDKDGEGLAPLSPFADTDPSVHKRMSAKGRAASVRVAAIIQAYGRAMLSWWSSTSSPKLILDIYGGEPKVVSSTTVVSIPARLAMSSVVSRQLDLLPGHWVWDLERRPESPRWVISFNRLAACAMEVSWRWRRALSCNLAAAISAWTASGSKSDSLMRAAVGVDLVQPVTIRCCASSFMRLLSDKAYIQEDAQ